MNRQDAKAAKANEVLRAYLSVRNKDKKTRQTHKSVKTKYNHAWRGQQRVRNKLFRLGVLGVLAV